MADTTKLSPDTIESVAKWSAEQQKPVDCKGALMFLDKNAMGGALIARVNADIGHVGHLR